MKEYVPPTLTVDAVVFQLIHDQLHVLLIQRTNEPFKGTWALPGGYCQQGETTTSSLQKIVLNKAGVDLESGTKLLEQLYTFDAIGRDPRGHAVDVTYMALGINLQPQGQRLQNPTLMSITQLPELAYDHAQIIEYAHNRLKSKLNYTNVIYGLLPDTFTFSQLQKAYEAVLCRPLDKRNFRKRIHNYQLVRETGEWHRRGAHRPAKLYAFQHQRLQSISKDF